MSRLKRVLLAAALSLAPLGAQAADLVVWWQRGFYAQEDEAVAEIVAAFEQETDQKVVVSFYTDMELPAKITVALESGQPPDFAFGFLFGNYVGQWAFEDRLADLSDAVGHFADLFDPDALDRAMLVNAKTGQRALYGLPMGRSTHNVHAWKSLLEQAGFTLEDIPKEWHAFWSFWCDEVQPAVRRATRRQDVWGVGLPMSPVFDTQFAFIQFLAANRADYVTRDGRLVIDEPQIRQRLVRVLDSYTAIYRKGCTPPDAVAWGNIDNNKAFLAQAVVMTANETLSIPNALKRDRPDDYFADSATIAWPLGPDGEPFAIGGVVHLAVVFKGGAHVAAAFSGERLLPPMQKLLNQPFWPDPSDPHRMAAVMQAASRPLAHDYAAASGNWRHSRVEQEYVWGNAVNRVVAEGITPEQAVDEAMARIKQILSD